MRYLELEGVEYNLLKHSLILSGLGLSYLYLINQPNHLVKSPHVLGYAALASDTPVSRNRSWVR